MRRTTAPVLIWLGVVTSACAAGAIATNEPAASAASAPASATVGATVASFPSSDEPVAIEPGTYRIRESAWSVADFTVTFPEGWTVQYGQVYASNTDAGDEFGFYPVVVEAIYADACEGETGGLMQVGPSVDDLAAALLQQPGPVASGPVEVVLGGYPATRIDLTIPEGFDLEACSFADVGLQVWYSPPADKYFALLADGSASVYMVDVNGQRQVFLTQHRSGTPDDDLAELQLVLDSIHFDGGSATP